MRHSSERKILTPFSFTFLKYVLSTCLLPKKFVKQPYKGEKHIKQTNLHFEVFFSDGVRQFVVVTSIDKLGVPNSDMKNAYRYPRVYEYCKKVSEAFGVDLLHVIPVSNYFDEVVPNDAKNAMSLFNLWRVFISTKEYIERRWLKEETVMISQEWPCKKNNV